MESNQWRIVPLLLSTYIIVSVFITNLYIVAPCINISTFVLVCTNKYYEAVLLNLPLSQRGVEAISRGGPVADCIWSGTIRLALCRTEYLCIPSRYTAYCVNNIVCRWWHFNILCLWHIKSVVYKFVVLKRLFCLWV